MKKDNKQVMNALVLVFQFGINMVVPLSIRRTRFLQDSAPLSRGFGAALFFADFIPEYRIRQGVRSSL